MGFLPAARAWLKQKERMVIPEDTLYLAAGETGNT
jgi:hypothetical protein